MSDASTLTAADLDAACAPLADQVRTRRVVAPSVLEQATPTTHDDPWAWVSYYGQLRAWLAMPAVTEDAHAAADALVTRAITDSPVPVPEAGEGLVVYPKSFATLSQLHILSLQLDRFTARVADLTADGTPLEALDAAVDVITACSYVQQLVCWAWLTPGPGLPWDVGDAHPVVPEAIQTLTPTAAMRIAAAVGTFAEQLVALQHLIDPTPAREGGRRPSWSGLFEALGAEAHVDPRDLAVTYSLGKVLAMTRLAGERLRPAETAA